MTERPVTEQSPANIDLASEDKQHALAGQPRLTDPQLNRELELACSIRPAMVSGQCFLIVATARAPPILAT
jgi:hypothetical protein